METEQSSRNSSSCSSPITDTILNIDSPKYDVFLSFRGEDTRKNFMGHLRVSLFAKGIKSFIDDDQIERGRYISTQLLQAIEDSKCSIVIFSPNYASSTWCLDELVKIIDCMKTRGQIVIPIFYNIDPSDIRKQTGRFGESFAVHEQNLKDEMERINGWRTALKEVTALAGLDIQNYRDEASFIRDIVEDISSQLSNVMPPKVVESLIIPWIRSAFGVVRALFLLVFLFLVVFPLFGYFFFNVVVPVIEYVLGVDQGTHSSSYCDITIDGKTTRQYGSDCGNFRGVMKAFNKLH
ncbi:disease resistance protein RPV1 [Cannabis sativa]|uniref:disease resistance protein RPV1 n=1 Tax=Cannabis sativa TaxID=3483 RepID=UPI0029C9DBC0|nr:disease resistance protein RPV1 [Cannabis sativa]